MVRRTDVTLAVQTTLEQDVLPAAPEDQPRPRPNYGGDLETLLGATPSFRIGLRGYDRLQVDNYVAWAEIELRVAQRENDGLIARNAAYATDLDLCQRLLAHSPAGREFARISRRVEEILQLAADEAADLVASGAAEAERLSAKARQAQADAQKTLDQARAESERILRTAVEDRDRLDQQAAAARAAAAAEAAGRLHQQEQRTRREQESAAAAAAARLAAVQKDVDELSRLREKSRAFLRRMTEQISQALNALAADTPDEVPREGMRP